MIIHDPNYSKPEIIKEKLEEEIVVEREPGYLSQIMNDWKEGHASQKQEEIELRLQKKKKNLESQGLSSLSFPGQNNYNSKLNKKM